MPNNRASFITKRHGSYGSSLYAVTAHWVLRCSGNSNGRTPETFIRQRSIKYVTAGIESDLATVGSCPKEGGHDGNPIVAILDIENLDRNTEPASWTSANGVSWATAVDEINAAFTYARTTQRPRASRAIGSGKDFAPD